MKSVKYCLCGGIFWGTLVSQCFAADIDPKIMGISVKTLFERTTDFILRIAGSLALLALVIAGIFYIASNGDPGAQQKAKNMVIYVLEGLVIILLSYSLIAFVNRMITQ